MKVDNILEYQKLDSSLYRIEKQLRDNPNKKKVGELYDKMKNAQSRSYNLEDKAGTLLAEIDKVKKQVKIQEDKMNEFLSKDIENMTKENIEKLKNLKDKLNQNLIILEKNLTSLAESMNATLAEFNKTIKAFNSAKEDYNSHKQAYDNDVKSVESEKNDITNKLKALSKKIDPSLMEAYEKRRRENIFPVLVPIKGNSCGGCHMELPFANITKLGEEGLITCDHCRRIIYK